MIHIPACRIALVAFVILLMAVRPKADEPNATQPIAAQPEAKTPASKVVVELVDGSRVLGETDETELKVSASMGEIDVPFQKVTQMVFNEDHQTAVVTLANGDHLDGVVKMKTFSLQAIWGRWIFPWSRYALLRSRDARIRGVRGAISRRLPTPMAHGSMDGWRGKLARSLRSIGRRQVMDGEPIPICRASG